VLGFETSDLAAAVMHMQRLLLATT
jgi:hypothetical protein